MNVNMAIIWLRRVIPTFDTRGSDSLDVTVAGFATLMGARVILLFHTSESGVASQIFGF